jgi:hypothetical protein
MYLPHSVKKDTSKCNKNGSSLLEVPTEGWRAGKALMESRGSDTNMDSLKEGGVKVMETEF